MVRDYYCACRSCGSEFFRYCIEGGGGRQCVDAIERMCLAGDYGTIPQHLLSEDCPIPISVHLSPSIYCCPECGSVTEYWNLSFSCASVGAQGLDGVDPHVWEGKRLFLRCPHGCDAYMDGPFDGDEALGVVDEHRPSACPNCGSSDVHPVIDHYLT